MSGAEQKGGFAGQLLSRAEGTLASPKPKIGSYYDSESGGNAPPIVERVIETPAPPQPRHSARQEPTDTPERVQAEHTHHAAEASSPGEDALRLVPVDRVRTAARQIELPAPRARAEEPASKAVTPPEITPSARSHAEQAPLRTLEQTSPEAAQKHVETALAAKASRPPPIAVDDRPLMPWREREAKGLTPRSLDLQAAIAQLLGSGEFASTGESADSARESDPVIADVRTDRTKHDPPVNKPETARQEPPVTIHIGEVVVAPEPSRPRELVRRASWQPPITLDDYRARRAGEWQ